MISNPNKPWLGCTITFLLALSSGCVDSRALDLGATFDAGADSSTVSVGDIPPVWINDEGGPRVASCPLGATQCGNHCVTLQTDRDHCGACFTECGPEQVCVRSECVYPCDSESLRCTNQSTNREECADPETSTRHCGRCGNTCVTGQECLAGMEGRECACPIDDFDTEYCNGEDELCDLDTLVDEGCPSAVRNREPGRSTGHAGGNVVADRLDDCGPNEVLIGFEYSVVAIPHTTAWYEDVPGLSSILSFVDPIVPCDELVGDDWERAIAEPGAGDRVQIFSDSGVAMADSGARGDSGAVVNDGSTDDAGDSVPPDASVLDGGAPAGDSGASAFRLISRFPAGAGAGGGGGGAGSGASSSKGGAFPATAFIAVCAFEISGAIKRDVTYTPAVASLQAICAPLELDEEPAENDPSRYDYTVRQGTSHGLTPRTIDDGVLESDRPQRFPLQDEAEAGPDICEEGAVVVGFSAYHDSARRPLDPGTVFALAPLCDRVRIRHIDAAEYEIGPSGEVTNFDYYPSTPRGEDFLCPSGMVATGIYSATQVNGFSHVRLQCRRLLLEGSQGEPVLSDSPE